MKTSHATPESLFTAWLDISTILEEITHSASEHDGRLVDTIDITRLAWRRWRSRLHASAIHMQELHVRLASFIVTLRALLGSWQSNKDTCDTQQLDKAWEEALELHVGLKDIRRLPPLLGGQDIVPPVPLRLRCGSSK